MSSSWEICHVSSSDIHSALKYLACSEIVPDLGNLVS